MSDPKKLVIAWHPATKGGLSFRGSEIALYDYADQAERILGHKSIIVLKRGAFNEPLVLKKFKDRFDTILEFSSTENLEDQLSQLKVHACYFIRSGKKEDPMLKKIPMLVHCVYDMSEEYGSVMAGVSESVAKLFGKTNFVPHMVNLDPIESNYRSALGIPEGAIVFGRHGGADTWDIPFAKTAMIQALKDRPNLYFIFAVRPFILNDVSHPRVICLECFADSKVKRKFINTFDAFFHAQSLGETFGLSVAEASSANKPVIVFNDGRCQEHLRILGDKCIKYGSVEELYKVLVTFDPKLMKNKNWRAYEQYKPEIVMKKFDEVFLQPIIKNIRDQ